MASPRALTREELRELDRRTIGEYGLPSLVLMENAGRACADEAAALLATAGGAGPVLVLCGPGNNGGDGFVVARTLENRGLRAEAAFVGGAQRLERLAGDARLQADLWRRLGHGVATPEGAAALEPLLAHSALVVDALFGTGLDRELRPPFSDAVHAVRRSGRPVLAVDLPSGLDANTGAVLGAAVAASVTVTFVAPKRGLALGEGPRHVGRVVVAEIGVPRAWVEAL